MTCPEIRDRFCDLMDGEAVPEAERHLADCQGCAREWAAYRGAVDAVRGLPQRSAPAGFADSVRERLERERLLAEPGKAPVLPLWRRPAFLGKSLAAAAVLLIAVHLVPAHRPARAPEALSRSSGLLQSQSLPAPQEPPALKSPEPETGLAADKLAHAEDPQAQDEHAKEALDAQAGEELKKLDDKVQAPAPVLLAWVMPAGDPEAAAGLIREAFEGAPQREPQLGYVAGEDWKDSGASARERRNDADAERLAECESGVQEAARRQEERQDARKGAARVYGGKPTPAEGAVGAMAEKRVGEEKAPEVRVLSFRVRASELPGLKARLSALGARPASPQDKEKTESDLPSGPAGAPARPQAGPAGDDWVILTVLIAP